MWSKRCILEQNRTVTLQSLDFSIRQNQNIISSLQHDSPLQPLTCITQFNVYFTHFLQHHRVGVYDLMSCSCRNVYCVVTDTWWSSLMGSPVLKGDPREPHFICCSMLHEPSFTVHVLSTIS